MKARKASPKESSDSKKTRQAREAIADVKRSHLKTNEEEKKAADHWQIKQRLKAKEKIEDKKEGREEQHNQVHHRQNEQKAEATKGVEKQHRRVKFERTPGGREVPEIKSLREEKTEKVKGRLL